MSHTGTDGIRVYSEGGLGRGAALHFNNIPEFRCWHRLLICVHQASWIYDCSMLSMNILFLSLLAYHQSHDVLAQGTASSDAECERGKLYTILFIHCCDQ